MKAGWWVLVAIPVLAFCAVSEERTFLGSVNSPEVEYGAVQTDVGIFLTRAVGRWGEGGTSSIVSIDPRTGVEAPAEFADPEYDESDPFYDELGKKMCFVSTRPVDATRIENAPGDIWCAVFEGDDWSIPFRLPAPVNSPQREYSPAFDLDGNLYFASDRAGGLGEGDIYRARQTGSGEWLVEPFGSVINSRFGEWNVGVSPAGEELIFEASSRPQNRTVPGDLYYSRREGDSWTTAIPLSRLNSDASDLMARWHSGDQIVFASARKGNGDVDHYAELSRDWRPVRPAVSVVSRSLGEVVLLDPESLAERRRMEVGAGPHEIAISEDGRRAVVPLLGVYPEPHEEPVTSRPPFIEVDSEGIAVVDLVSGQVERHRLVGCRRPHGVAVDAQSTRAWITCEEEGAVVELDPSTAREVRRFAVGDGVHKVMFVPAIDALLTTNPDDGTFQRIGLGAAGDQSELLVASGAEGFVVSQDGLTAWVAASADKQLCRIDVVGMDKQWCVDTGGMFPIALALAEARREVWVSRLGSSDIAILSAETGDFIEELDLPSGALELAANQRHGLMYATLPRQNRVLAIRIEDRQIQASYDGVMEGDNIDLVPSTYFSSPPAAH